MAGLALGLNTLMAVPSIDLNTSDIVLGSTPYEPQLQAQPLLQWVEMSFAQVRQPYEDRLVLCKFSMLTRTRH
jgi:hypothetical protein